MLARPELRSGDVDTTWLDRMQLQGDIVAVRHADVAVLQAAIEISQAETAADRARFYAFARRGRPEAAPAPRVWLSCVIAGRRTAARSARSSATVIAWRSTA